MRKCGSCGYLLLGDGDACGRCGTPFPVVSATAAASQPARAAGVERSGPVPVQLPSFGRLSIPPPVPAPAPAPAYDGGSAPPPAAETRESWPGGVPPVSSRPPRATRLGVIALVVALAFAAGFGVMHLRSDPLPAGTSAFVAGGGFTYTSPDGSFQVRLPQAPAVATETITLNSMQATVQIGTTSSAAYAVAVGSISFPDRATAEQVRQSLDAALNEGIGLPQGKLVRKDLTVRGTLPAVEGRVRTSDGRAAHVLVVASDTALILVAVAAKSGTDRLYRALEASLIVR